MHVAFIEWADLEAWYGDHPGIVLVSVAWTGSGSTAAVTYRDA